MEEFFDVFWNDGKVGVLLLLIALDFLLGVVSALKRGTFRLAFVADFVRKDVVFKIGGYLVLYAGAYFAGQQSFIIDGLDLGVAASAGYAIILAAMVGSIANSVKEIFAEPNGERDLIEMVTADEGA